MQAFRAESRSGRSDPNEPQRTPPFLTILSPACPPGAEFPRLAARGVHGELAEDPNPGRLRRPLEVVPGLSRTPTRAAAASRPGAAGAGTPSAASRSGARRRKDRSEVLVWLAADAQGRRPPGRARRRAVRRSARSASEWLDGVERGRIGRRRGTGKPYSDTTIASMRRRWQYKVRPEFGDRYRRRAHRDRLAALDRPARPPGPVPLDDRASSSRSRRASTPGPSAPSRRLVQRNPLRLVELPPNDEKPRHARRARARGRGAARRARARGPSPLRDRLLRRPAPLRDLPPRMARRPRRRPHRHPHPRHEVQERRRHAPPPADRRQPPHDPRRRLGAPGPPARRQGRRPLRDVRQDRRARRRGLETPPASTASRSTSAATPTPRC